MSDRTVTIPQSAIDWILGEGPDEHGEHFGDNIPDRAPRYWWRSHFRELIADADTPPPQTHVVGRDDKEFSAMFEPSDSAWHTACVQVLFSHTDRYMLFYEIRALAERIEREGDFTGFLPEKRVEQINPDRSKFPYRWEGPRPPEAIIHKVINAYMGEDPHEHDNSQFLYHLANWESHYTLNQRMKTAMEAENAVCEATDGVATDLDNTEIFNESR